jgi:predicted dipeptidase
MLALALLLATAPSSKPAHDHFHQHEHTQLVPLLVDAIRFPTVEGNRQARIDQAAWLKKQAEALGFTFREGVVDAPGTVVEIDLPGPTKDAPVLGLVVHGDVVTVEGEWTFPPFEARVVDGFIQGRGAADDKGPLVQALLAMKALKESGIPRTHTIRLLVGSDEESGGDDVTTYLKQRPAPDVTLVLDSEFPVVVGEMAWNAMSVEVDPGPVTPAKPGALEAMWLHAGTAASIVPDKAELVVKAAPDVLKRLEDKLKKKKLDDGTSLSFASDKPGMESILVRGRAAHSGVNIENGRNALVSLARLMDGELPESGIATLLDVARRLGPDLHGRSTLGLTDIAPGWKPYNVNVGVVDKSEDDAKKLALVVNIRRPPPWDGAKLRAHVEDVVKGWLGPRSARVTFGGYYKGEPKVFDPSSKLVKRLLDITRRATGVDMKPAISGGGTYAKRMPNAIAFGMWFPELPYPGHDVDERVPVEMLERGTDVLIEALVDLACGERMTEPLSP